MYKHTILPFLWNLGVLQEGGWLGRGRGGGVDPKDLTPPPSIGPVPVLSYKYLQPRNKKNGSEQETDVRGLAQESCQLHARTAAGHMEHQARYCTIFHSSIVCHNSNQAPLNRTYYSQAPTPYLPLGGPINQSNTL